MLRLFRKIPMALTVGALAVATAFAYDPYLPNTALEIHAGENSIVRDEIGNTITNNGVIVSTAFDGKYGYFNGSAHLEIADSADWTFGSGNGTIEGWMYWDGTLPGSGAITLWGQNPVAASAMRLSIRDVAGTLNGYIDSDTNYFTSTIPMPSKAWTHVAFVKNGTSYTVYVNGISGGSKVSAAALADQAASFYVGSEEGIASWHKGFIDSIRVTKGIARYTTNFTPAKLVMDSNDTYWNNTVLAINFETGIIDLKGHTVTNTGVISIVPGKFTDSAMYFNGSSYFTTPYTTANFDWWTTDFTVEAWVNASSFTDWEYTDTVWHNPKLIGNANPAGPENYWSFGPIADGSVVFYYFNGTPVHNRTTITLSTNQWHHISAVKSGTTVSIFIDGVPAKTFVISGTPQSSAAFPITVGKIKNTFINGMVSDLRITKGIARYNSGMVAGDIVPTTDFLDYRAADYYWDNTVTLIPGDTANEARGQVIVNNDIVFGNALQLFNKNTAYLNGSAYASINNSINDHNFGTGDFTIENWVNIKGDSVPAASGYKTGSILSNFSSNGTGGYSFAINGDTNTTGTGISFGIRDAANVTVATISGNYVFNKNTWYHVAATRVNGIIYLFVNGVLVTSGAAAQAISGTRPVWIGMRDIPTYASGLIGNLADVRVTKGVGRYKANFSIPKVAYPNYGTTGPLTDIYSKYTNVLISGNSLTPEVGGIIQSNTGVVVSTAKAKTYPNSLYFNSNYFTMAAGSYFEPGAGDFTTEFWFNTAFPETRQWFFHSLSDYWLGIDLWNNKLGMWASSTGTTWNMINSDGGGNGIGTTIIQANTWYHVAFVRKNNVFSLYLNGVLEKTITVAGTIVDRSAQLKRIGNHANGLYPIRGYVQDFRFTKHARYLNSFIPPTYKLPVAA